MAIFGHERVYIEKVPSRQVWEVRVVHKDPQHRHLLVEVKWEDAFKRFPYAPDYDEALCTCQDNDDTALTLEEEDLVHDLIEGRITREEYQSYGRVEPADPQKVLSFDDFRRRKKT